MMQSSSSQQSGEAASQSSLPQCAVVIATRGRPEILCDTLRHIIDRQTHRPSIIIVSCVVQEDAGAALDWPEVVVLIGKSGLAAQRNTALEAIPNAIEFVTFFDDDFVPAPDWLEIAAESFRDHREIVSFTGHVVVDDIKGPGLNFNEAVQIMKDRCGSFRPLRFIESFSPYGCNMAFRASEVMELKFDERLVLYGWLEDRDFGATLAKKGGRLVKCINAEGVHMGVKSGRVGGERLGYSQIINPLYMLQKGTMTQSQALSQILKNLCSNVFRFIMPEPFIDRRGRLRGNLRATFDLCMRRVKPERALQIGVKTRKGEFMR